MLRQPSTYHAARLGEGYSSTAIDRTPSVRSAVWNNPAGRGSALRTDGVRSAVP
jgi:hypothetical protein